METALIVSCSQWFLDTISVFLASFLDRHVFHSKAGLSDIIQLILKLQIDVCIKLSKSK